MEKSATFGEFYAWMFRQYPDNTSHRLWIHDFYIWNDGRNERVLFGRDGDVSKMSIQPRLCCPSSSHSYILREINGEHNIHTHTHKTCRRYVRKIWRAVEIDCKCQSPSMRIRWRRRRRVGAFFRHRIREILFSTKRCRVRSTPSVLDGWQAIKHSSQHSHMQTRVHAEYNIT